MPSEHVRSGSGRPIYTPSYMASTVSISSTNGLPPESTKSSSYSIPRRQVPPANSASQHGVPQNPAAKPGLLVTIIAGSPHKSTISFLETILSQQSLGDITLVAAASAEPAIKQLKMDIYALIGKLRLQVGVHVLLTEHWTETSVRDAIDQAMVSNDDLQGVLCCPEYEVAETSHVDILDLDQSSLERSWKHSVGFVHATSKACMGHLIAHLPPKSAGKSLQASTIRAGAPFFILVESVASSAASSIVRSACNSIIKTLREMQRNDALAVGLAETLLPPLAKRGSLGLDTARPPSRFHDAHGDDHQIEPISGESPTKLWNMWSLVNEVE